MDRSFISTLTIFVMHVMMSCCHGADLFTSTDALRLLSSAEDKVVPELELVLNSVQQRIHLLKIILNDIKESKLRARTSAELALAGHPVHAYNLIKRWRHIEAMFWDPASNEAKRNVTKKDIPAVYGCKDMHKSCPYWAKSGECRNNPSYMTLNCKLSCEICAIPKSEDQGQKLVFALSSRVHELTDRPIPDKVDYIGSLKSIIRLQRTYKLSTENILAGNIKGYKSVKGLKAEDFYHLGESAVSMGEWGYGAQWLRKAAMAQYNTVSKTDIYHQLAKAFIGMNDYNKAMDSLTIAYGNYPMETLEKCSDLNDRCTEWQKLNECVNNPKYMRKFCPFSCNLCHLVVTERFPGEHQLSNTLHIIQRFLNSPTAIQIRQARSVAEPNTLRSNQEDWRPIYEKLCRGQGKKWYRQAVCRYHPATIQWNVYKEEILSMNPRISMIYDVINDTEADILQSNARDIMERASVGSERRTSDVRVSMVGWLGDDIPFVKKLSERVELITGLEVTDRFTDVNGQTYMSSDSFQAVNYGIGGHYEPHTDYFKGSIGLNKSDIGELIRHSGDRIATFLVYLTDIKAGGGTVYPKVKIQVPPIKNAAAFWYNSRLSGDYDPLTMHAGCPVLLGEKWVCNKWVREFHNEFRRRCQLSRDAVYS